MRPRHHSRPARDTTERRGRWTQTGDRDRAQLILVSALVLAITLVALSLVVNSVIYTENLATQRDAATGGALNFQDASNTNALVALGTANFGTDDRTYLQRKSTLRAALADWKSSTSRFFAREGLEVDASVSGFVEGTRVSQDIVGPFVPVSEDVVFSNNTLNLLGLGEGETWLAAEDTSVRRFEMTVERDSRLYETGTNILASNADTLLTGNEVYALYVEDVDGEAHRVYVYEDTSYEPDQVSIAVYDQTSGTFEGSECTAPGDSVSVDLTAGTMTGNAGTTSCDALGFWDDTDGPYDIYHVNGNSVNGTYSFLSDVPTDEFRQSVESRNQNLYDDLMDILGLLTSDISPSDTYYSSSAGSPYTNTAIYAVDVTARYETADIAYQSSARFAPGEPTAATPADTGGGAWGTGVDNANPEAEYTVDSATVVVGTPISLDASGSTDPDGSITDHEWSFGDGATDTGVTESHTYSSTGTYEVTLTVTDDEGATGDRARTVNVVSSDSEAPVVDSVAVTDTSTSGSDADTVEYDVDWAVSDDSDSDADDLAEVRIRLVADPGGARSVVDSAIATVEGDTATSTLTVGGAVVDGCGEAYEVVVTVEDRTGMTDTEMQGVTASC